MIKPSNVASINPEDVGIRFALPVPITVLDCDLRLAVALYEYIYGLPSRLEICLPDSADARYC